MTKLQLRIICYILIIPAVAVLNYAVFDPLLIPDACEDPVPSWAKFFYTIDSSTGFHPEPNVLNLISTLILGMLAAHTFATVIGRKFSKH